MATKEKQPNLLMTPENGIAVRRGIKTQTRRLIKPQPVHYAEGDGLPEILAWTHPGALNPNSKYAGAYFDTHELGAEGFARELVNFCPYGKVGTIVAIREAFYAYGYWTIDGEGANSRWRFVDCSDGRLRRYHYLEIPPANVRRKREADTKAWYLRPALFMPKAAVRSHVIITEIRAQPIQAITEADAIAEGVAPLFAPEEINDECGYHYELDLNPMPFRNYLYRRGEHFSICQTAVDSFRTLFTSINGPDAWKENRWVWALTFELK